MKIETMLELTALNLTKNNNYEEILNFLVEVCNYVDYESFTKELINRLKINLLD